MSHIESFFAEQKRKNGAAGKKKLRYRLDSAVSNPVPHGTPVVQPWDFFFFFFFFFFLDFCCAATELYTVAEPLKFRQKGSRVRNNLHLIPRVRLFSKGTRAQKIVAKYMGTLGALYCLKKVHKNTIVFFRFLHFTFFFIVKRK